MHDYPTDKLRGQQRVADATSDRVADLVEHEPVTGSDTVAVDQGLREAWIRATHTDPVGFVEAAFVGASRADRHTRNTLQRIGDVLVRHLADVFGSHDVHDRRGGALLYDRLLEGEADAGNDDFLQILIGGRLIAARLRVNCTIATEQSHGDRRSDQRRPCDSHDLPTPDVVVSRCPFSPWPNSRKTNGDRSPSSVRAGFPTETTYMPI